MEAKKEKEIKLFISLIFSSLILIGLDKRGWLNWLKRPVEQISNPVKKSLHWSFKNFQFSIFNFQSSSQTEPAILQEKIDFLERENADLKVKLSQLEKENESIKKLLGAPLPAIWRFIPAKVLSVKNGIMTINQGLDVGIKENQVVVFENVLVGRIIKVNPQLSKIMLPTDKDSNIKAKIIEANGRGMVRSEAGNVLILDEVLQEVGLLKGQVVVTTGEEEIYPPNLIIGKIESVVKEETAIYQKAVINPLVDYEKLEEVFVVQR